MENNEKVNIISLDWKKSTIRQQAGQISHPRDTLLRLQIMVNYSL